VIFPSVLLINWLIARVFSEVESDRSCWIFSIFDNRLSLSRELSIKRKLDFGRLRLFGELPSKRVPFNFMQIIGSFSSFEIEEREEFIWDSTSVRVASLKFSSIK
jgi:ATP-dependent RNA circularization protein (DNA/RNA ligase family)